MAFCSFYLPPWEKGVSLSIYVCSAFQLNSWMRIASQWYLFTRRKLKKRASRLTRVASLEVVTGASDPHIEITLPVFMYAFAMYAYVKNGRSCFVFRFKNIYRTVGLCLYIVLIILSGPFVMDLRGNSLWYWYESFHGINGGIMIKEDLWESNWWRK